MTPGLSRWAYVRALLISVVLLVQCTSALPDRKLLRRNLARPEAVRFLELSERSLNVLGIRPGRPALEQAMLRGSALIVRTRGAVVAPFERFFHYTATRQQWGLFLLGSRECFRIHVDARTPQGRWDALYHALQQSVPRYEAVLRYRRVRGIYNPSSTRGARPQYGGFVRAFARWLFAREPGYDAVRVRMERLRVVDPGQPALHVGFEDELEITRAELPAPPARAGGAR